MTRFPARRSLLIAAAFLLLTVSLHATSHVYVLTEDGVWLASDSLLYHNDDSTLTRSTTCKVVIRSGRLLFNAGYFQNFAALKRAESALPLESPRRTVERALDIMRINHQDLPLSLANRPDLAAEDVGVVQVVGGTYRSYQALLATDLSTHAIVTVTLQEGIPHGFGSGVDAAQQRASRDPAYAKRIARSPKTELIRILESEASEPNSMIGGPFTVFLLRPDGSVSDFSDQRICESTAGVRFYRRDSGNR